ncbi:hypothetical protein, partial [Bacillus sp. 123MFChir2]|uniref:hypothetical protein n=1 Tax=Bacillus sp. 123MFChir2 TaxID=1169144 RepID=UPI0005545939
LCFKLCTWQEKELTASMHGQLLSPTEKEKGFYVSFSICIYIDRKRLQSFLKETLCSLKFLALLNTF